MTRRSKYLLEEQVGHLLRRANQRHTTLFQDAFAAQALTTLQFATLMKLWEQGELSQNQLGRLTAMDPNTTQGVIQRLERRGYVERRPDPEDRRRKTLALTPAGHTLASTLVEQGLQISELTLAPLDASERRQFLSLLRKLT